MISLSLIVPLLTEKKKRKEKKKNEDTPLDVESA